jgi:glycerate-2-kinase
VIGRFPWDPFPPGEVPPPGDDPLMTSLYRAAVEGGDAYRAVRSVLRRDQGVLRVGNRFVPDGRYREVGFVALGHAASSMALAALHVFGDRLTQGFIAGPETPPAAVPFRWETIGDGWGGEAGVPRVLEAAREIAGGLRESDLLLLLLSPGALRALLLPPTGLGPREFTALLQRLHLHGASGAEVTGVARVLGTGGVGGRLLPPTAADVQCLIVDRGDGPVSVGGGPTFPVTAAERQRARASLDRAGELDRLPPSAVTPLERPPAERLAPERRPVVVAGPAEAVRSAGDAAFDKGWTSRVGVLGLKAGPADAADRFLESVERVLGAERQGEPTRTKGLVVFATTTLGLPEGVAEGPACQAFLGRVAGLLRRREMSVGLFRTAGPTGPAPDFSGAVVGAPGEPPARAPPEAARPIRMRRGITDVGLLAVALVPTPPGGRTKGATPGRRAA